MKRGDRVRVAWNGRHFIGTLLYKFRPARMVDDIRDWRALRRLLDDVDHWEVELVKGGRVSVPLRGIRPVDAVTELGGLV